MVFIKLYTKTCSISFFERRKLDLLLKYRLRALDEILHCFVQVILLSPYLYKVEYIFIILILMQLKASCLFLIQISEPHSITMETSRAETPLTTITLDPSITKPPSNLSDSTANEMQYINGVGGDTAIINAEGEGNNRNLVLEKQDCFWKVYAADEEGNMEAYQVPNNRLIVNSNIVCYFV